MVVTERYQVEKLHAEKSGATAVMFGLSYSGMA